MAFSTFKEWDSIKTNTYHGFQSLSTLRRSLQYACKLSRRLYFCHFVISAETLNIFLPRQICRCQGRSWRRWTTPFSSRQVVLWHNKSFSCQKRLVRLMFCILLSRIFSIFSIKIQPISVLNTSPQSYSKSIPAVNNYVLLHVILLFNHSTQARTSYNYVIS